VLSFTAEVLEAFLKILSYCFELFEDRELIAEILKSNSDYPDQTLREFVEEKCVENGFDESLKSFREFLSENSIEHKIVLKKHEKSESTIETDEDVAERKSVSIEISEQGRKKCCRFL
jgi:hypothetical protein